MINGAMNYRKLLIAYRAVHLCRHVHRFRALPVVRASSAASSSAYRRSRLPCPANGSRIERVNQFSGRSRMKQCLPNTKLGKPNKKCFYLHYAKQFFVTLFTKETKAVTTTINQFLLPEELSFC